MDFSYDDEQRALRDAVRGLAGRTYADHEHRRRVTATDPGFDERLWSRMADMGLLGLPFAEDDGGVGAGPVEVGIVCQELGAVAAPEPYLSAVVLAGGLVAACGTTEQRGEIVGPLAGGERLPAFAHAEPGGRWTAQARLVVATQEGSGWTLTGTKEPVPHGARAEVLVVSAALPAGGTGLFLVDPTDATITGYPAYDGTRAARVDLDATSATPLGQPGRDLTASITAVLDLARVMAANQALGAMRSALDATTDYLRSRRQFGVPLATFQDLTFRAADMYVSLELTRSVVDWATMVAAHSSTLSSAPSSTPSSTQSSSQSTVGFSASSSAGQSAGESSERGACDALADAATRAALQTSRGGRHVGQEAIQLHGGIAMTAEYYVSSLVAQLTALDHLLGDGHHQLGRLAAGVTDHGMLDPLG